MSERRQLNVLLDNEPELYEAIRDQAHQMNVSVSAFIVMALKSALDWQIPFDAPALLKRTQALEKTVRDLTRWKEAAELKGEQNHTAHVVELNNLKKRLVILEHACELELIKHDPTVGEQLISDFLEKHAEKLTQDLISQEEILSNFSEKHGQRFKNDPVAARQKIDEFLENSEKRAEQQFISQEETPITRVNVDSQGIENKLALVSKLIDELMEKQADKNPNDSELS